MKKLTLIFLILLPATVAYANPIAMYPSPVPWIAILEMLAIEIVFSYKVLTFYGLSSAPTLIALFAANAALFAARTVAFAASTSCSYWGVVMCYEHGPKGYPPSFWVEVAGVVAKSASIILLSRLACFRKDPSVAFKWRYALFAVLGGNFIFWWFLVPCVGHIYRTVW